MRREDRDQLAFDELDDRATLERNRGQGAGTGDDRAPGEEAPAEFSEGGPSGDTTTTT